MIGLFGQSHTNVSPFYLPYPEFHLEKKKKGNKERNQCGFNLQLKCGCGIS